MFGQATLQRGFGRPAIRVKRTAVQAVAGLAFGISALAPLGLSAAAQAQAYPTKPVRFLVGFAAGGPTDILARSVANAMSKELSEQIIVENRPGA
jgi:tripartite-type tricarboxylate transporter receptor subunit TctC